MEGTSGVLEPLKQCHKQLKVFIFNGIVIPKGLEKFHEAYSIDDISNVLW